MSGSPIAVDVPPVFRPFVELLERLIVEPARLGSLDCRKIGGPAGHRYLVVHCASSREALQLCIELIDAMIDDPALNDAVCELGGWGRLLLGERGVLVYWTGLHGEPSMVH